MLGCPYRTQQRLSTSLRRHTLREWIRELQGPLNCGLLGPRAILGPLEQRETSHFQQRPMPAPEPSLLQHQSPVQGAGEKGQRAPSG